MASPGRYRPRSLTAELLAQGPAFRFFQAVRLLALSEAGAGVKPALPPGLRFASPLSLGFPASEIATLEDRGAPADAQAGGEHAAPGGGGQRALEMTVGFLGMTGPAGVLPVPYTELLIERRNHFRDTAGHRFLDLFTHRATALFYQAWRKHRFYLPFEAGETDGFSRHLLDLVGVGLRHLQHRLEESGGGIPDRFLIHYAGLLSQKPMSAANIAAVVSGYFGVAAELEQFVGQWMLLPIAEQTALGGSACRLGEETVAGERQWDRQTKVRLRLGPLAGPDFAEFMPGRPGLAALRELIRFCVGFTLDCDVNLVLRHEDIPQPVLGGDAAAPQLGYNLWLNSLPAADDADDACFALLDGSRLQ